MVKRIDIGTDIATIGVWDPSRERHDLKAAKYENYKAGLRSEAEAGRLFFVETGSDGGYLTDIYVDEQPDPERLTLYEAVDREFLIESQSGRLIAGGLEDFVSQDKQITSEQDQFAVTPGFYAIKFYQLKEEKLDERVRNEIGDEDYAYYESRFRGFAWGCFLFVIAAVCLFCRLWLIGTGMFTLGVAYVVIRSRIRAADKRFQSISARIDSIEEHFPGFIYVLRSVTGADDVKGGWHGLTESD